MAMTVPPKTDSMTDWPTVVEFSRSSSSRAGMSPPGRCGAMGEVGSAGVGPVPGGSLEPWAHEGACELVP